MKRREFVKLGSWLAGTLASRQLRSAPPVRAAVVIGVDKAGDLPPLKGAAAGALKMAEWLQGEGFQVISKVDTKAPVKRADIFEAVAGIAESGAADQLVVYFAGHGFNRGFSEFWLLSGAPRDPGEAISVIESTLGAKLSGIPNVVFISDACRSRADSLGAERVHGAYIFPNPKRNPTQSSKVDIFLATLAGDPSYEVSVSQSVSEYQGIYTAAFLDAFQHPDDTMVVTLGNLRVVPNRRLEGFLVREVRKRAEKISFQLRQIPDTQVNSPDNTYIGRVQGNAPTTHSWAREPISVHELAWFKLAQVGVCSSPQFPMAPEELTQVSFSSGFDKVAAAIQKQVDYADLARTGGLAISGTEIKVAQAHRSVSAEFVSPSSPVGNPIHLIRVDPGNAPAASVALQFDDGGGTVVAAIKGFVAIVSVSGGHVVNVSYVPALDTARFLVYESERARLDGLHSVVATSARLGVFRIEGHGQESRSRAAERLAGQIRVLKGIDPTLGIYAAYAYSNADLPAQIMSTRRIMRDDLGVELFDIDMLSGALTGQNLAENKMLFPFCPMLWQGWNLLRVLDVRLAPEVLAARDSLRPSLWTTFNKDGIVPLLQSLREGRLR